MVLHHVTNDPKLIEISPRPYVPNGSLKVMRTLEMLLRFQIGWKIELANLCGGRVVSPWLHTCTHYPTHTRTRTHTHTHTHTHRMDSSHSIMPVQRDMMGLWRCSFRAGATVDLQQKVEDCYYDSTLFICHL